MEKTPRVACVGAECVACGCCVKVCPKNALHVHAGIIARVDGEKCVGCGKCAAVCPAAVVTIVQREVRV